MEKIELYNQAKEAYYTGNPIMGDAEFDALEKELELENKSSIGTAHHPTYTVPHPYMMGSLSKVQVHADKNGTVDWDDVVKNVSSYIKRDDYIKYIMPKYDGCSFEMIFGIDDKNNIYNISCSNRGDGEYGKDLTKHLEPHIKNIIKNLNLFAFDGDAKIVLRGEVLINKMVFEKEYSKEFVNPRSFVAGTLGADYDGSDEQKKRLRDLSIIIYHVKTIDENDGTVSDHDIADIYNDLPKEYIPYYYQVKGKDLLNYVNFRSIYDMMDLYRRNCPYNLDGFVINTAHDQRENNLTRPRPIDCVAIKFLPMVEKTTVTSIEWNLGKSGEYIPNVRFEPVKMDGKMVSKANGFNYGYLIEKRISPGTKIVVSLAGDIIPYIYKIVDTTAFDEDNLGIENLSTKIDGVHLMADLSNEDKDYNRLVYSILSIDIPGMGKEMAIKVADYFKNTPPLDKEISDFFGMSEMQSKPFPKNVFLITPEEMSSAIGGRNGQKISTAYKKIIKDVSLPLIIKSCQFKLCGDRISEQIANYISNLPYEFTSMPGIGYQWVMDPISENSMFLNEVLEYLGKPYEYWENLAKTSENSKAEQIPIIMTGEPNNYATKAEFLRCHPEYRETGSWKEVKIVFTNSLESNTGKMKKAREKNIEIQLY